MDSPVEFLYNNKQTQKNLIKQMFLDDHAHLDPETMCWPQWTDTFSAVTHCIV